MTDKTVTINGMVYDRQTGRPLRAERGHGASKTSTANTVHASTQKSRTLSRKYVRQVPVTDTITRQKPIVKADVVAPVTHTAIVHRKKPGQPIHQSPHPSVSRFARTAMEHPSAHKQPTNKNIAPQTHTTIRVAEKQLAKKHHNTTKITHTPSQVLKNEAIAKATAAMPKKRAKSVKQKNFSLARQRLSLVSGAFAILLMGGYFTYLNMPALSTRVAATQAGISATYPAYRPSGYSLSGPVAYSDGKVSMKFAANAGPQSYTLSQTKSGWDSSAVLENYVTPNAGDNYSTQSVNGLTIYTYGSGAVWVNGGIMYSISGDAPLSSSQVERIATSL